MTNRQILEEVVELIRKFNPEESKHEAFVLVGATIREDQTDQTHDFVVSHSGGHQAFTDLFFQFLRMFPKSAFPALHNALHNMADEKNVGEYAKPMIDAIFIALAGPKQAKKSSLILPNNGLKH